tara:strand:+ start:5675 stop:6346 length:672 start_codon:yes stop_codon:yes gene_type:complete
MSLKANNSATTTTKSNVPALEAGGYPARLVQIVDLGVQEQRPYQGDAKPDAQELLVTYELSDEFLLDEEGNADTTKPRWLSETFPLFSLRAERAKSTQRMLALDPKGEAEGDWSELLGKPCTVTIVANAGKGKHLGRTFNNVAGVTAMRSKDADALAPMVNPGLVLDLDEADVATFDRLPEWIQTKIEGGVTYATSKLAEVRGGAAPAAAPVAAVTVDEDCPF